MVLDRSATNTALARAANCAAPQSTGLRFGEILSLGGQSFRCTVGLGWTVAQQPDGAACSSNSACQSGYCNPGPDGKTYCLAANMNCAVGGEAGARFGTVVRFGNRTYLCEAGRGWTSIASVVLPGQFCQSGGDCASGVCRPGPLERFSYCVAEGKTCALPRKPGAGVGEAWYAQARGHLFICLHQQGWAQFRFPTGR